MLELLIKLAFKEIKRLLKKKADKTATLREVEHLKNLQKWVQENQPSEETTEQL